MDADRNGAQGLRAPPLNTTLKQLSHFGHGTISPLASHPPFGGEMEAARRAGEVVELTLEPSRASPPNRRDQIPEQLELRAEGS